MKLTSINLFSLKSTLARSGGNSICWCMRGSVAGSLMMAGVAEAADQTWKTAGFTDGNWATTTNWVAGAVPGGATGVASGDTATFNGGANLSVTPDATRNIKNITFDSAAAGAFVISGGGLVLTNAGAVTINANVINTQTINTNLLLSTTASSTYSFVNNSSTPAAKLNIGGNVTGQAVATNEVLTLGGTNGGTVSGIISNGSGGGSVGVTKSGAGTWTLNGSAVNTFTGGLNISVGTLALDFSNLATPTDLLNSGNALTLGSSTSLSITAKTGGGVATSQTLGNVAAIPAGGASILIDPNNSDSATLALGTVTATATGSSLLLGKALTANTGTVAISTATDKNAQGIYGGRIILANGTANTGYDFATTASGAAPYTLSAFTGYTPMVAGATTDTLNQLVTASLTLSGAHTHNSLKIENPAASQTLDLGANLLTLNSGGLLVTGTNAFAISGTAGGTRLRAGNGSGSYDLLVHQYNSGGLTISAVIGNNSSATGLTKTGGGSLTLSGANTYTGATTISGGAVTAGVASVTNVSGAFGNNSAITFTNTAGTAMDITGFNTQVGSLNGGGAAGGNITLGAATLTTGGGNLSGSYAGVISGTGNLSKIGSGIQTLTGANNYSGTTTISAGGSIQIGNGGSTGALGSGNVTDNGRVTYLRTGTYTVANNISGTGDIFFAGVTASPTMSGTLNVPTVYVGATQTVTLTAANTINNLLISSSYTGSYSASLVPTVILGNVGAGFAASGNVALANGNYSSSGVLQLAASDQIAHTAIVSMGNTTANHYGSHAYFALMGYDATIKGLDYTGGSTNNRVFNGATANSTLTFESTDTRTYSGQLSNNNGSGTGTLAITKNGIGTQIFSGGSFSYSGGTTINAGTLSIRTTLSNSDVTVAGGTLDLRGATLNKAIAGTSGNVDVTGGNTTSFGGGNKSYSVDTALFTASTILLQTAANSLSGSSLHDIGTGATLRTGNLAGSVKALTGGGSVDLNGTSANLTITDGASQDFAGVIGGTGKITKSGAGTQTLSGLNTYTGDTTVSGGTLSLATASLADTSTVSIASGATLDLTHGATDNIVGLVINGVPQADGLYKSSTGVGAGTVLASLTGTGKLMVTPANTYASWMGGYSFAAFPGADLTADGDADQDGIRNVLENVFGTAPNASTTGLTQTSATGSTLTFKHPLNPSLATDVTYSYQWSSDLVEWKSSGQSNTGGTTATISAGAPVAGIVTVTSTISAGPATKLFARIVAVQAP